MSPSDIWIKNVPDRVAHANALKRTYLDIFQGTARRPVWLEQSEQCERLDEVRVSD